MSVVTVSIEQTQFPGQVRADLFESLRRREVNHKFHYDSVRQTERWLALHEAYSPARTDLDCLATYEQAFVESAAFLQSAELDLISLGCGGGQKDSALLRQLRARGMNCRYFPCDVAVAMALVAHQRVSREFPEVSIQPAVCDLETMQDVEGFLTTISGAKRRRLLAFFGMMPNFEPGAVLTKLASALRVGDHFILSANLAPGADYEAGVRQVLPLYDNDLTKEWLITFLLQLGLDRSDGMINFEIEPCPSGWDLRRITGYFTFVRARRIAVYGEEFDFNTGERIRLFFSYRYTLEKIAVLLREHRFKMIKNWLTHSREEGVFLCVKESSG